MKQILIFILDFFVLIDNKYTSKEKKKLLIIVIIFFLFLLFFPSSSTNKGVVEIKTKDSKRVLYNLDKHNFSRKLHSSIPLIDGKDTLIANLTIIDELQDRINILFKRYHPMCGAAVIFKPSTGEILSANTYINPKANVDFPDNKNILSWGTLPAASLFKFITASALIDNKIMNGYDKINYNGKNHTLYKDQLKNTKNKWTRTVTMKKAFVQSYNPPFGKMGTMLGSKKLCTMAEKLNFNSNIPFEFALEQSVFLEPTDAYSLSEMSCGFTNTSTMNIIHAAVLAALPITNGKFVYPHLVKNVEDDNKVLFNYQSNSDRYSVLKETTALELYRIMKGVTRNGTARKSFKHLRNKSALKNWTTGGKTGSLDSELPKGRCDWFMGFAKDSEDSDNSIAIAVVQVHGEFWNIHSAYLAAEAIRKYAEITKTKRIAEKKKLREGV